MDTIAWNLIDKYFKDNPSNLVAHHLDSYNDFFSKGIFQIFRENNPIRFIERESEEKNENAISKKTKTKPLKLGDKENPNECLIYLGGKNGDKLYFGKPVIYDEESNKPYPHYMYPNDARLRNMNYGVTIHYDIEVDFIYYNGDQKMEETKTFEKIYLGRFPIMIHSNLCILKGLTVEARFNVGECRNDSGGYFIISGKEKVIVSQEKFGDNMLYVRKYKEDELYSFSCEVHSVSEDSSKPIRYTSAKVVAPDSTYSNNQIVIDIPNVKKPIPLFILMRALGVISDKSIVEFCLLDLKANSNMIDLFIPSVHDANTIFNQQVALEFISKFTKRQTVSAVQDILINYFLPHIGEDNFLNKAYFIGFMVNKLLRVFMGRETPTDRDNFKFKRIETSGSLIYDLFREYYLIQKRNIFLKIDKEFYYHSGKYRVNFVSLIEDNLSVFFKDRLVEDGFKKGFKGNWGADANTKRLGLVQDLNRLSWFTHISHLRKISLPLDPTAKIVGPHLLHSTQWGIIDPVDTPDGGNVGLHKHMAISTAITNGFSSYPIIKWIRANTPLKLLTECNPSVLATGTKVFVNGNWIGILDNPVQTVNMLKLFRRNGIIPMYTSISFSYESNIIYIYTDSGRLTRPIFYRDTTLGENGIITYGKLSYDHGTIKDIIQSRKYNWSQVVSGFEKKNDEFFNIRNNILYDVNALYSGYDSLDKILEFFEKNRAIIDYIDTSEEESALIATFASNIKLNKYYTHCEIDPSLIFGVMGNSIIYPESNQFPRDCFSCGQSRQAVSVYHSNSQMRMDKMGVLLNYGQTPLIKSRYLDYINREEQPYGVNAIVAIMSYTGYNVEDAILINEASVKRGIFRTNYYTTYEAREESSKVSGSNVNSFFANIESKPNVKGIKDGFDYSKLDSYGLVKENTPIDDRVVLIGEVTTMSDQKGAYMDNSKTTKKGQLGFVDKAFISEGEEGFRIAKIRIREERLPAIGDKMACALPTQQVLTNEGWIEIQHIDITKHKVATLDINGNMCYELPINKFEYDQFGKMYSVKNKQVEIVCTLNHKLYVKRREKTKGEKDYELLEAQHVMGKMVRFQKSLKNVYPDIEIIEFGDKKYKMDDWLQLLGMFIADGSVNNRAVILSAHKQRKIDFNTDILTKLDIEFYHDRHNGYFAINIGKNKEIYNELKKYSLGALNKYLPNYVWSLSKRQCIILLEALMEGDGHTYVDGFSRYGTISIKLANDVCRLAVHCGWSGITKIAAEPEDNKHIITGTKGYLAGKSHIIESKNTYYKISIIRKQNQPYINKKVNDSNVEKIIDYEGKVYCVEMPSSHLYYMRENNFAPSMLIGNSRAGQKGTLGLIIPEEDMPFTADGVRPDLIINPHALPSRMTIGQLVESLFGKACCMYGGYGDCTAFATKGANYDTYGHMLTKMGYHNSGNQILYNGYTGEQIYSEIFVGPTYYMRLKHMVKDKINYRATGKRNFLTRQTNQGRANDGGLKIGEMERDGIMANGLSYFLNESYMVRGDQYYMAVCNKTGAIAVYNPDKNLFLSPFADGPLVFNRNVEGQEILDAISKFGRTFSVVRVPFALKLLIQELQVMNIQMRIITEDNIDQLTNLSYQSRNIDKLLHIDHGEDGKVERDIKEIIENYKKSLEIKLKQVFREQVIKIDPGKDVEPQSFAYTPEYAPYSPEEDRDYGFFETGYTPPELQTGNWYGDPNQKAPSTPYVPNSPQYDPNSPQYDPNSPQYDPNASPQYAPYSPAYESRSPADNGYSPPWTPIFDEAEKNDAFFKLPKEIQDKTVRNFDDNDDRWNFIVEQTEKINNFGLTPPSPSKGGSVNIFPEDPNMNSAFNMLSGSSQAKILQMEGGQRRIVMGQIIRQSARQSGGNAIIGNTIQQNQSSNRPLVPYFEALPVQKQLTALQGGYNSMSKEFNTLAKSVHNEKLTITKPKTIQEQLAGKLPLLSVDQKDGNTESSPSETFLNTSSGTSSDNTTSESSSSSSSDSSIRKISFA
jgi:DNA-directed RNA polymerase II subunit RPB2